jgi:hypothetical protein
MERTGGSSFSWRRPMFKPSGVLGVITIGCVAAALVSAFALGQIEVLGLEIPRGGLRRA